MVKVPLRTYVVALVSVGLCGSTLLVPAAAGASAGRPAALTCKAKVSNAHPKQYTSTTVEVHTAAYGAVTTVAHYKSTNTTHKARANKYGNADIVYKISGATVGRSVPVTVTVSKGSARGSCRTSFTPRAR